MKDTITVAQDGEGDYLHLISGDTTVCGMEYSEGVVKEFDMDNAGIWCKDCLTGIRLRTEDDEKG